jgi:hypothetical protein
MAHVSIIFIGCDDDDSIPNVDISTSSCLCLYVPVALSVGRLSLHVESTKALTTA